MFMNNLKTLRTSFPWKAKTLRFVWVRCREEGGGGEGGGGKTRRGGGKDRRKRGERKSF